MRQPAQPGRRQAVRHRRHRRGDRDRALGNCDLRQHARGLARAVRHAAGVAGVEHVALGSDWDGAVTAILDASETVWLVQALLDQGSGRRTS